MIRDAFQGYRHKFSIADRILPLCKYRGERTQIVVGLKEFMKITSYRDNSYKGYGALNVPWDGTFDKLELTQPMGRREKIDNADIHDFRTFLSYCKENGITTYLVYSPEYKPEQKLCINRDSIIQVFQNCGAEFGSAFIDFSNDSISFDKSKFYNSQHMNQSGSELFTRKLVELLQQVTKSQSNKVTE
jgi:hypothetical protein